MNDESIPQQNAAWMAVCDTLSELMPGWLQQPGTGLENAVAAIRKLAARDAQYAAMAGQEPVAWIVSSGPQDFPLLEWLSADHSFRAPIGSMLYAAPAAQERAEPVAPAVQTPITEEMHVAAVKVLHRANGLDGLPQRMLDAMIAAQPAQPSPEPSKPEMAEAPSDSNAEPVARIEFRRGEAGRENEMPRVVSCNWLPDGTYEVYPATLPPTSAAGDSGAGERETLEVLDEFEQDHGGYYLDHNQIQEWINKLRAALATKPQAEQEAAAKKGDV